MKSESISGITTNINIKIALTARSGKLYRQGSESNICQVNGIGVQCDYRKTISEFNIIRVGKYFAAHYFNLGVC